MQDSKDSVEGEIPSLSSKVSRSLAPKIIKDFYYGLTCQPRDPTQVAPEYVGPLNHYNNPFPYDVYGSYPRRDDFQLLELKIRDKDYEKDEVWEYLKKYAEGFKTGYSNFETEIIKAKSGLFSTNEQNSIQIIFDYVITCCGVGGFSERRGAGVHKFSNWEIDGKHQGYFYKALCIIVDNYKLFVPLFNEHFKQKETDVKETPEKTKTLALPVQNKTLRNIWLKGDVHYEKVLKYLETINPTTGYPFIRIIEDKPYWQNYQGSRTYLAAFVKVCIERGYIPNSFGAPDLKCILEETFHLAFNHGPLKPVALQDSTTKIA